MKLIITYLSKYKFILFTTLFFACIQKIFAFAEPFIFQRIIDDYLIPEGLEENTRYYVFLLVLLAFGVTTAARLTSNAQTYYVAKLTREIGDEIYTKAISHYLNSKYSYIEKKNSGEMLSSIQTAKYNIESFITGLINVQFSLIISIAIVTFYSFKIHWSIAPIVLLSIPIVAVFVNVMNRKTTKVFNSIFYESNNLFNRSIETIRNISLIKSLGLINQEVVGLKKLIYKTFGLHLEKTKKVNRITFFQNSLINIIRNVMILHVLFLVLKGEMTVGELFSLVLISNLLLKPVQQAGGIVTKYKETLVSLGFIKDLFEIEKEETEGKTSINTIDSLNLNNISFSYTKDTKTLTNISFKIKKGETLGIIGASGSGKSTLLKLLIGLYFPIEGNIAFNGINIKDLDLEDFRQQIGYVSQSHIFFSGSIRENMRLINNDVSDEEIIKVMKASDCAYLARSSGGLDTQIGESGVKLSGGEKQRLSIARALLRKPKLLLFDEITSALDHETEQNVSQTINKIINSGDFICVIVSHRLPIVSFADNIAVLEKGKLIEYGDHDYLLSQKGYYANYYHEQMSNSNSDVLDL